jgi:YD repeat-containing protein
MAFVTAPLQTPSAAQTYYGAATTHTNSLAGVSGFGATPPEIVETARALKNNPDAIFDFVHDQIQTEFAFGERKGPVGALIDKWGTPFDQNVLFVNLVRQAGYTAQYQIGQVTMTQAAFTAWTGVSDLGAACRLLSSGGIPATFSPSAPSNCATSGAFTSVTLLHIWSQVNIGGTLYAYDPSFKTYAGPTPVNLVTASGFTAGASATAAASGMTSGTQGGANYIKAANETSLGSYLTTTGTTLLNWLKANASSPALDIEQVTGITKIVQVYAPSGGWRNATPPGYTTGTSLAVTGDMPDQYRSKLQVQYSIKPDQINLQTILNWTFYVDDIDGRRVEIASNFNNTGSASGGNINPATYYSSGTQTPYNYTTASNTLMVDDTPVQSWSCTFNLSTCYGGLVYGTVTLTATHPYMTTFANQTVTKLAGASGLPVAIISGWGMITPARLAKWSGEMNEDTALPEKGVIPWLCDSEGGYCWPAYLQSSGDLTRQKLAASWLAQITRMMQIQAAIGGAKVDHQHSIGVVDWQADIVGHLYPPPTAGNSYNYYGVSDEFTELNIDTTASVTSLTNNAGKVAALSRSIALASATLEGSVLDQMEDLPDTASTASRIGWGNNPNADNNATNNDLEDPCWASGTGGSNPRQFFDFTGTSSSARSGIYVVEGSTTGCTSVAPVGPSPGYVGFSPTYFTNSAESAISQYLAAGFHVTASAETFLGPGARAGACQGLVATGVSCDPSHQRGDAVIATNHDGSGNVLEVAHVLTNVISTAGSSMSKGGGGKQPENFAQYDPAKAAEVLKDRFKDRSVALGVDLKTGAAGYSTPTLISIGAGEAPYKLDYAMTFKAADTGCNDYGPCVGPISGGWNQSWDVRLNLSASGQEALGTTSPYAAAGTLVAFLAMQDLFGQAGLANLNQDIFAALAADWWRGQIVGNAVTISHGFSGEQYVRQVDGNWMAPVGAPGVLTQTGTRTKERLACHSGFSAGSYTYATSRTWVITGTGTTVSFSLRNAAGDTLAFSPWFWKYDPNSNDDCAQARGWEPTTWTWPQGLSLTFTYGTQSGGVTTDYSTGVTAITTSLGRSMAFTMNYGASSGATATTGGVTVGQQASGAIADAVAAPSGGNTGKFWNFAYTALQPRTATQRPVPYPELYQVFDPVSASLAALQYGYDTRGVVKTAYDANGLQLPGESGLPPYTWYLALTGRGERDDPDSGAYTVWYDTDGDAVRNIDEIGRETDSTWDGRHRVATRTFPEGDQEVFAYDLNDNTTALVNWPKPGSPLSPTTVTATYEPTWNHLASITDALRNTTTFAYYASGNGASLMQTATRPIVGGFAPVYSFTYNAIGLPTQTVDPAAVTTTHAYDGYGNLTSTTEGASGGTTPQWGTAAWSSTGATLWGTAALSLTTTFTPDSWGNVTAVTTPLGHVSNTTFDLDRRKLLEIEPNPGSGTRTATNTIYDGNGRVIEVDKGTTNSSGGSFTSLETTTTAFDPNGNKTQVSVLNGPIGSAALTITQVSYDPLNRPICTAERNNAAVFGSLPASACTQSTNGPAGPDHITQLAYDLAGQKLTETRGVGTSIAGAYAAWTYGLDGEVATILDNNSNLTTNLYDGLNRLAKVEYPMPTLGSNASNPTMRRATPTTPTATA